MARPDSAHDPMNSGAESSFSGPDDDDAARRTVLGASEIARAVRRMAHEILERNDGAQDLLVLGIPTRGVHVARRLGACIGEVAGREIPVGVLDVTPFRDDRGTSPRDVTDRSVARTRVPEDGIDEKVVVLADDVLYSGRTIRAALDALADLGRPRAVRLAVLVDRGHRELPIRADHVGKNLPTSRRERVHVGLTEVDGVDRVDIRTPRPQHEETA